MSDDPYRDSVIQAESGYLSDEIEETKLALETRIDEVLDQAKLSLKQEVNRELHILHGKVSRLGGSSNSTH